MSIKEWILRSFLIVQTSSALSILPQDKKVNENFREPAPVKVLDGTSIYKTESLVQGKRRFSLVEKMLVGSLDENLKLVNQLIPKDQLMVRGVTTEPKNSPKQMLQAQRDKQTMSRDIKGSALLGKPYVKKMLVRNLDQNSKFVNQLISKNQQIMRNVAAEPKLSPKQQLQAQRDEEELKKMSRDVEKSALLGKPYIEKKGRNDFLVIQGASADQFVTVIPNSIYYNVEKKCVNWLDACSLRGIRSHLLQRVESPYK